MRTIDELLLDVPVFAGMEGAHLELMAGCAQNRVFAPGEFLLREGDEAEAFFIVRHGAVSVETFVPQRGALTVETLHENDLLGWSWLTPPYRTVFDARALIETRTVAFDGVCLRTKCEEDHDLGFELTQRFMRVVVERLQATRMRLLNLYGSSGGV